MYRNPAEQRALREMPLYDFWSQDPISALELMFIEGQEKDYGHQITAFMNVSYTDRIGIRYGSFTNVTPEFLTGRRFIITMWDGKIGVEMVDVWFLSRHTSRIYGAKFPRLPYEILELGSMVETAQCLLPVVTW